MCIDPQADELEVCRVNDEADYYTESIQLYNIYCKLTEFAVILKGTD